MEFSLVIFHWFFIKFSYENKISLGPPSENFTFHRVNIFFIGFSWTKSPGVYSFAIGVKSWNVSNLQTEHNTMCQSATYLISVIDVVCILHL